MQTVKVFKKDNKWMFTLSVIEEGSTLTITGPVTDASELPALGGSDPTSPIITKIDNTNSLTKFVGNWAHGNIPGHFDSTLSFSNTKDNTITLVFEGHTIRWFTEKLGTHGIAAVSVDNKPEVNVDLYSPLHIKQVKVFEIANLGTLGQHTIKIRVTGTKNLLSSNSWVAHDYFEVVK